MKYSDMLREAAEIVKDVMKDLETDTEICKSCNILHWTNREEKQMHMELEAVVRKIERISNKDALKRKDS